MAEFRERRKIPQDPEAERRLSDRVTLLEVKVDGFESEIDHNQNLMEKLFTRLDEHVLEEGVKTGNLEKTMIKVTNTVDNLTHEIKRTNDTLAEFASKVSITNDKVKEWDTTIKTIVKIATISAILIGAGWSVVTMVVDHKNVVITTAK